MGFRVNSALNELSKRDTLTMGGYTYHGGIHLPWGDTPTMGRYTYHGEIHFSNNDIYTFILLYTL